MTTAVKSQQLPASMKYMNGASEKYDPLVPRGYRAIEHPIGMKKVYITVKDATLGSWSWVDLPKHYNYHRIAVKGVYAAPSSGNYTTYPGMAQIEEYGMKGASNSWIQEAAPYRNVMRHLLPRLDKSVRDSILASAGGTAFNAGTCIGFLPLPFDPLLAINEKQGAQPGFPAYLANYHPQVGFKMRSADGILDAGAADASLTSVELICWVSSPDDKLVAKHKAEGYRLKTHNFVFNTGNTVATATATTIDTKFKQGILSHLSVQNSLASDVSTAHDYFLQKDFTVMTVKLGDTTDYYKFDTANEGEFDQVALGAHKGDDSTLGHDYVIPFGADIDNRAFGGGADMDDLRTLDVRITHALGANATVDILGVRHCFINIDTAGNLTVEF